ncbi:MAG: alpha/beta hydrolase [Qipengyuania sp.]|nr:alpha/beta hydrolase [Qipengyuania sp.]
MLEELLQAIPIEAGTMQSGLELHSGIARLYPRVYGNLVRIAGSRATTGIIMVHPMSNFHGHHLLQPIATSGIPILGLNTRYAGNDAVVILENCLLDIDAAIRWVREHHGWQKVILCGFSGGGPLVSLYQRQAENPTITATPAGDPPDLTKTRLAPADALLLIAASPSRSRLYQEFIDPSVIDERDPDRRDPEFDLYAPGREPPYDRDWLAEYRLRQKARVQRIEDFVVAELKRLTGLGIRDRAFITHRTVADPRFLDLTIDPDDRAVGTIWGDARAANEAPGPMGRMSTLRSWLSTWSPTHSNGDSLKNLPHVSVPIGMMPMTADQGTMMVHGRAIRDAAPAHLVDFFPLKGMTHYFYNQPEGFPMAVKAIRSWMERWGLADGAEGASQS